MKQSEKLQLESLGQCDKSPDVYKLSCNAPQRLFRLIPLNYQRNALQAHTGEMWGFVGHLLGIEKS
ncbi:MAG: hypothetical protein V3G42_15340 [Oscillospiraceae bacterium]